MVLNFFLFPAFVFIFYAIGNYICYLISKFYLRKINKKKIKIEYFFFEKLLYAVFFIGFISLILNFFLPLDNYFVYFIFALLIFFSILFLSKNDINEFKKNIIFILLISILPNIMEPGYDAGLYHIPYQTWIKNYETLIGLSNLNLRFSLASIYNYIAALMWRDDVFLFVAYLSTIFYLIFFLFLKEFLIDSYEKVFFGLLILLTFPLWNRYIYPSFSLVDAQFGIISIITLTYFFFKIDNWFKGNIKFTDIFLVTILFAFLISLKASGILFIPLLLFFYLLYLFKIQRKKILLFPFLLLTIFISIWFLRGFLVSGCLFYPLELTCFNVVWFNYENLQYINSEISLYALKPFKLVNLEVLIKKNFYTILFLIILFIYLFIICIKYLLELRFKKIDKYFFIIPLFLYFLMFYQLEDLRGFSTLVGFSKLENIKSIIINEITNITLFFLISFMIIFLKYKFIIEKINKKFFFKKEFIIFIYLFFLLLVWLVKAPQPRLGYGFIPLVLPMIYLLIFNFKNEKINNQDKKNYNYVILFFVAFLSFNEFNEETRVIYDLKILDNIRVENREDFGKHPSFSNLCWNSKDCYIGKDKKIIKTNNLFRKIVE